MAKDTSLSATTGSATADHASSGTFTGFAGATHALLRIGAGLLFMQHGAQKLFGWLGGMGGSGASADLFSLMGLAGVLEFFGGLLVALGVFTVPVAGLLVLQMVVAYFMGHASQALFPIQNGGELALLYALVFLFLAGHGAGPWSVGGGRSEWWR